MASVAVPGRVGGVVAGRRSLVGVVVAGIAGFVKKRRAARVGRGKSPGLVVRVALFVREMMGSTLAFGAFTYGMWQVSSVAGWITLGAAVMALDFQASNRGGRR